MARQAIEFVSAAAKVAQKPEDLESPFDLQPSGLVTVREPNWVEWQALGEWLKRTDGSIQFWIGDWVNIGEHKFGERCSQALDATGWEVKTILQYRWVCDHVPIVNRTQALTFFHHREVADLTPDLQKQWLTLAEEGDDGVRWSVQRLREELNKAKHGADGATIWVVVEARNPKDAEEMVARFEAEGRKVKTRGLPKDESEMEL